MQTLVNDSHKQIYKFNILEMFRRWVEDKQMSFATFPSFVEKLLKCIVFHKIIIMSIR